MNIKLTLDFSNMEDLAAFVSGAGVQQQPAPAPQPPAEVIPMPEAPAPVEMPPMPEPEQPDAVDFESLRQDLATRLRALVDKLGPDPIREFVNKYGVDRFSELPDDQLQAFDTALREEYGQ